MPLLLLRRLGSLSVVAAMAIALLSVVRAVAEEPEHYTFSPAPPGTVVQDRLVYLSGEAMHSQWRAVASKKLAGAANGTSYYQWYLSIYSIDETTYRRKYESPANGGPLSTVEKAPGGSSMWYPLQTMQIVGSAELVKSGVQQLVVQSHETGADCGSAIVSVFTVDAKGAVVPAVSLRNGCELTATIAHGHGAVRDSILLRGPYYSATAPMCCPTKPKATAVLSYRNGKWVEIPRYYALYPGAFPPN